MLSGSSFQVCILKRCIRKVIYLFIAKTEFSDEVQNVRIPVLSQAALFLFLHYFGIHFHYNKCSDLKVS